MKLYDFKIAPNPRRVRIFLAEKGIELETVQVNIREGEQFSEAHRKRNPTLDVPVLELDDGTCIHQVDAICRYIEEVHPEPALWGRNPVERARVEAWNHQIWMNGFLAVGEAYRNTTPIFVGRALSGPHNYEQSPEMGARGLLRIDNFYADMDKHFEHHRFVLGDYYSVADITAYVTLLFAKWVKRQPSEDQANLTRWYREMDERPSSAA